MIYTRKELFIAVEIAFCTTTICSMCGRSNNPATACWGGKSVNFLFETAICGGRIHEIIN